MTTTYSPAHAPGSCETCDWIRSIDDEWIVVPEPPDCSECVALPGGGHSHDAAPLATQAGLAKPAAMHPATVPALDHGGTVRLPGVADDEGRHPPVTRPRTTRRPGSS